MGAFATAQAGILQTTSPDESRFGTEKTEEEAYIGLEWKIGQSILPEVEVGFRHVDVKSNGDVSGGQASLSFDIERRTLGKFKLEAVEGDDDLQGQLGIGYNLADRGFLITGGAQGNHVFAGLDYTFGTGLDVMAGINTLGDYDAPDERVTLSCPDEYTLDGETCNAVVPEP
jgi:hypothetical protein